MKQLSQKGAYRLSMGGRKTARRGPAVGWLGWMAAGLVLLGAPATSPAAQTATEAMKGTIDEVIRILEDEGLKKESKRDERRSQLEKVIGARFDYEEMAKRSLGAQWAKLDEGQRREFVELFRQMLSRTYADKIESYHGEPIQYLNERLKDEYAEVKTKVMHGKAPVPLDYRLMNKGGDWRVYDVVIDGISLVNNYRGQFTKIIRAEEYDGLVKRLKQKSDKISAP